jgi:hypothetical protein
MQTGAMGRPNRLSTSSWGGPPAALGCPGARESPRVSWTRTLPTVEPILLTPRPDPFDDPAWLFEPKYDGFRGLLHITPTGATFTSKRGLPLKRFAESK